MKITWGSDTFGRVRTVGGTPVVTEFATLQSLPIYPIRSYYLVDLGPFHSSGIPFVCEEQTRTFQGIPLRSIHKRSAGLAYARALSAAMIVVGVLAMVPGLSYLRGEGLAPGTLVVSQVLLATLVLGSVCGGATYLLGRTPRREAAIRTHCGERLGVAIDPAEVAPDQEPDLLEQMRRTSVAGTDHRAQAIDRLVWARIELGRTPGRPSLEAETDDLLERLRNLEP